MIFEKKTRPSLTGWSNLGFVAGTPFKSIKTQNIFPVSSPNRLTHPQEMADLQHAKNKSKIFGGVT